VKDFDLDDLFESDEPKAKVEPAPAVPSQLMGVNGRALASDWRDEMQTVPARSLSGWSSVFSFLAVMLICFATGIGVGAAMFRGGSGDTVEPNVDPVSGAYVAIFYQDTNLQQYSASQREFLNSVNTANWLEEHKANWKKIDIDDSVDRLEPPFPIMAEKHRSKEPWIVIAAGKKFASEPIESNEQAMKLLQKWVK
jgi:hypothetical protein